MFRPRGVITEAGGAFTAGQADAAIILTTVSSTAKGQKHNFSSQS